MIDPRSQQIAVTRLIPEVEALSPADLETISVCLLRVVDGRDFIHRGLNEEGRPTKATVDAFNDEGDTTLEVGSEKGYFTDPFDKVVRDVKHAITLRPDTQHVYLCSSRELRNTDEPGVQKAASDAANQCKVTIYCQRRLAEKIYEYAIANDNLWEALEFFLPSMKELRELHALTHSHPSVPTDAVGRDELVAELCDVLQREAVAYIHGMSGMGKTWVARKLIGVAKDRYDSVLWLNPGEFDEHSDLRGIRIARFGQSLNLKHRLTEAHCLLVVDDLRTGLRELLGQMAGTDSHCLVTSQLAPDCALPVGSTCPLSPLGRESIKAILQPGDLLDEQIVETIWRKTWGHPLSLAIIRDTAKAEGVAYRDLAGEMDTLPDWEDADTAAKLIDRILSRHAASVARELSVLKWLYSKQVDPHLLRAMGTPQSVGKLRRRSFVADSVSGLLTLHDIFLTCLGHYVPQQGGPDPVESFWQYFQNNWWTAPYHFRRSIQLHADKVRLWRCDNAATPCIQEYNGLLTEGSDSIDAHRLAALLELDFAPHACDAVALFCLVEAHEIACRQISGDDRIAPAERAIEKIDSVIGELADGPICANLHHHRGKFLRYARRYPEMKGAFETALLMDPTAYQAHLQLARIAVRDRQWPNAREHIGTILDAYAEDDSSVAITLVLDAFALLGDGSLSDLREKYIDAGPELLCSAIRIGAVQGYTQPYATLGRLAKTLYYSTPGLVERLSASLDTPHATAVSSDEAFDIAEFLSGRERARIERCGEADDQVERWNTILTYYNTADIRSPYQKQMHAHCLILAREYQHAINLLETIGVDRMSPWQLQRYAQALHGGGRLEEALTAIQRALSSLNGDKFRSAFLADKASIQRAMGNPEAAMTLKAAIDVCDSSKFLAHMEQMLSGWNTEDAS